MINGLLEGILQLFFPHICLGCGSDLLSRGEWICIKCSAELPVTNFQKYYDNPVERIFWGRVPVTHAYSHFYFTKQSALQQMLHQLKYGGRKQIGISLGKMMGHAIAESVLFQNIDMLIPLPLFPSREKKRGYNQAAVICEGIAAITAIPIMYNKVIRSTETDSQTKKSRTERWQNMEGRFYVRDRQVLSGKHVLLVDDVITTGATLDACASIILECPGTSVSIATLAYTNS